jgi:ribosomal protein S18 acetylase RimI-like enzyme
VTGERRDGRLRDGVDAVDPGEWPQLLEIWEASARATHHFLSEDDILFFRPLVLPGLRDLEHLFCVRDLEGGMVAFAGVAHRKIEAAFVHPSWFRAGVGRRLVTHALDALGATGVDVNEQNEQAVAFYRRLGFEVEGRSELDGMGKPFPLLHMRYARGQAMDVRAGVDAEIDQLARIWYDGWHDAHAQIVPADLTRLRTLDSFRDRLRAALPNIRVSGPPGAPVGFSILKGDELYQLFVSAPSRGSGVATALIADAEARLADSGVRTAWLACAIGNERAARFYQKRGWHRVGTMINLAETASGTFALEVWRYEKSL